MQNLKTLSLQNLYFLLVAFFSAGIIYTGTAQDLPSKVPTPVEFMTGNNRMFFQMVVKKKFSPKSKLGFLSTSSFSASYNNEMNDLDITLPVLLNYTVFKGFALVGGTTINNSVGFSPLMGIQHSFANKKWVAVTIVSSLMNSKKNVELFGIYEYKPAISQKINLYTRVQFLYIHSTLTNLHARSFMQLRTGIKRNDLNFGMGANLDQYGPEKTFKPNFGIFAGWAFQ
jgi:hypothetical protein